MVVQFKFFPFTQAEVPEWYRRLRDLAGGKLPNIIGFDPEEELNGRYFRLGDGEIIRLAKKYGAGYVLTTCRGSRDLALVFSNGTYCVYKPEVRPAL
jgi:hypothetical protein